MYVAKICRIKRQLELIRAFSDLKQRVSSASLLLVGGIDEAKYYEAIKREVARRGISTSVIFAPHVSQKALVSIYKSAAINISLSLTAGTDMGLREGLAACTASIVPNMPAVKEFLANQKSAVLVNPVDQTEITFALHQLLTDTVLRMRIQQEGTRVAETFDRDYVAKRFLREINDIRACM